MTDRQSRIAADTASYIEHMAAAKAGDPYAKTNAAAYRARLERFGATIPTMGATVAQPTRQPQAKSAPIATVQPSAPFTTPAPTSSAEDELVASIVSFLPADRRASNAAAPVTPIANTGAQKSLASSEVDRLAAEITAWVPHEGAKEDAKAASGDIVDEIAAFLPADRRKKV